MNGLFIWEFTCVTKWSFHQEDELGDEENYVVSSDCFDNACSKVKKLALSKSRIFLEEPDENNELEKSEKRIPISVEIVEVKRGNRIDG